MLFQHDPAAPIGIWREVREDSRGLFVRGQLMSEVEKGREVLALMRAGAIDGLSIGFRTVKGRTDAKSGVRSLLEVDLWEISVVTFPMLPAARVSAVKGMARSDLVATIRRAAVAMQTVGPRRSNKSTNNGEEQMEAQLSGRDDARPNVIARVPETKGALETKSAGAPETKSAPAAELKDAFEEFLDLLRGLQGRQRRAARQA